MIRFCTAPALCFISYRCNFSLHRCVSCRLYSILRSRTLLGKRHRQDGRRRETTSAQQIQSPVFSCLTSYLQHPNATGGMSLKLPPASLFFTRGQEKLSSSNNKHEHDDERSQINAINRQFHRSIHNHPLRHVRATDQQEHGGEETEHCLFYRSETREARDSFFVAHAAFPVYYPQQVELFDRYVRRRCIEGGATHPAMIAWYVPRYIQSSACNEHKMRASTITLGRTPIVVECGVPGSADDGETGAGRRILQTMASSPLLGGARSSSENAMGIVMTVSRWYGGVNLGGKRFELISKVVEQILPR